MNTSLDDLLNLIGRQTVELEITRRQLGAAAARIAELEAAAQPKPDAEPKATETPA